MQLYYIYFLINYNLCNKNLKYKTNVVNKSFGSGIRGLNGTSTKILFINNKGKRKLSKCYTKLFMMDSAIQSRRLNYKF